MPLRFSGFPVVLGFTMLAFLASVYAPDKLPEVKVQALAYVPVRLVDIVIPPPPTTHNPPDEPGPTTNPGPPLESPNDINPEVPRKPPVDIPGPGEVTGGEVPGIVVGNPVPLPPPPPPPPKEIPRVGGDIKQPSKLHDAKPVYP